MSLSNLRKKNKRTNSFITSKIEEVILSPDEVKEIKDEIFYNFVKPVGYSMLNKISSKS